MYGRLTPSYLGVGVLQRYEDLVDLVDCILCFHFWFAMEHHKQQQQQQQQQQQRRGAVAGEAGEAGTGSRSRNMISSYVSFGGYHYSMPGIAVDTTMRCAGCQRVRLSCGFLRRSGCAWDCRRHSSYKLFYYQAIMTTCSPLYSNSLRLPNCKHTQKVMATLSMDPADSSMMPHPAAGVWKRKWEMLT